MKKIAIIGGGITGLATAFYLQEHAGETIDYTLIECGSRLGGKIISARERGFHRPRIQSKPVYRGFGIRDGQGIVFISHRGDVYPAGFLPLAAGNVRTHRLADLYRNSQLFRNLRSPRLFRGKCGRCEYRALCGGSRARAFAYTGDPLASDPFCAYEPKASSVVSSAI